MPCIESYQKVDLRTITLGVPPQEVIEKEGLIIRLVQKFRKVLNYEIILEQNLGSVIKTQG